MDNIANMLTTIRNAKDVKHPSVKVIYSKTNLGISELLKAEGFIKDVHTKERAGKRWLIVSLKYSKNGEPAINGLERVSKPGKRVYTNYKEIPKVRYGYGLALLSTPKGIITGEVAKKEKVGGEILCKVW